MIDKIKYNLESDILSILKNLAYGKNIDLGDLKVKIQKTPNSEMGDLSILVFEFSKILQMPPNTISEEIVKTLKDKYEFKTMGTYLNIKLPRIETTAYIINSVKENGEKYGASKFLNNKKIVIEFSAPNTNKPLHVGHLRNDIIGESLSRIMKFAGGNVIKLDLINNRGVHISKSMLAYEKFGNNITPELARKKGDHLIGDFYVKYSEYEKANPNAENEIQDLLYKWEQGDKKTLELWQKLNTWAIDGIKETYTLTNISFDKIYLESETFKLGKDVVMKALKQGICYKREDGAICIDVPSETNNDSEQEFKPKVLLRANGTSIYLTQDLGNIVVRKDEFNFDEMIYVVGSEQIHHFKVLFYVAEKLDIENASNLIHLSHGMVNLPDGKMKSREGNIVDADNLIEDLVLFIIPEVSKRNAYENMARKTALDIALGAIHYYLLRTAVHKDIMFNKEESLSFNGNSGPYIQYVGARINSIFQKYNELGIKYEKETDLSLLTHEKEWELIKIMSEFEEHVIRASKDLNPSIVVNYSYTLAKNFSTYYQDVKIVDKDNIELTMSRIELVKAVLQVIKNCMNLLNIPYMTKM